MPAGRRRVCLILPHQLAFQPRTLREADALSEAGHDVTVLALRVDPALDRFDRAAGGTRRWRLLRVDLRRAGAGLAGWVADGVQRRLARALFGRLRAPLLLGVRGYVRGLLSLTALALAHRADWYVAHTHAALPVAHLAARARRARLGFDCEDLLGEWSGGEARVARLIEARYLGACDYVSVPSRAVADYLVERHGVRRPLVLYNVHPLRLARDLEPPRCRPGPGSGLRLHWLGQTLGPDRGVEDALAALAELGEGVELHVRARVPEAARRWLDEHLGDDGGRRRVILHPPVSPEELIATVGRFDVGLALERPDHGNCARTVSNKLFAYLLAGLGVAATDTPGQREVLEGEAPAAGFLYEAGKVGQLADGLRAWREEPEALRRAQTAAWEVAHRRFCWDVEQRKLLDLLDALR